MSDARLSPFLEQRIDRYRLATRFARSADEYADIALGEFSPAGTLHLFKASPHAYGPGKTHLVDETRRATFCGKDLARVPGAALWSLPDDIDCRGCWAAIERQKQRQGPWTDEREDWWLDRCGGEP